MKKTIIFILTLLFCVSCFAQKKYIVLTGPNYSSGSYNMYLTGDVPLGFKKNYSTNEILLGDLLNNLVESGFSVEYFSGGDGNSVQVLLSHLSSGESGAIEYVHFSDGDVREVARYNLQGMQVNENEKGIQIIVYSNYTTKTVIVE